MAAVNSAKACETGPLIVVLGPSGSGKDSLMSYARAELSGCDDVLFVQRAITRPAEAGGENHIPMTDLEFDAAIDRGEFALTWAANGLRYGLPRAIEAHLATGKPAIVNGSRGAWSVIRQVFPSAVAVEIRVDRSILAHRLQTRGRETAADIEARLARSAALAAGFEADVVIDNSGPLERAGLALVDYLTQRAVARS